MYNILHNLVYFTKNVQYSLQNLYFVQPSVGGYPVPTQSVFVSYVQRQFTIQTLSCIADLGELLPPLAFLNFFSDSKTSCMKAYPIVVLLRIVAEVSATNQIPYRATSPRISGTITAPVRAYLVVFWALFCSKSAFLSLVEPPTLTLIIPL